MLRCALKRGPGPLGRGPGDRLRVRALGGLLVALLVAGGASADEFDVAMERAERQVGLLEGKARLVGHELQRDPGRASSAEWFESRLNDGQALMLLKDHVQASLIFLELVGNPANRSQTGYPDALFNLGEALFFNKNFIDARTNFRKVLDEPRGGAYRRRALVRLMQIALRTNDFEALDAYRERLRQESDGVSPEGQYLWGRTLLVRGRSEESAQAFSGIEPGQPFHPQALYMHGVSLIRQGRLEDALAVYQRLSQHRARDATQRALVELGHLARGRLLHDLGRPLEALDAYQAIEHTSVHFDEALLETCWTFVKMAESTQDRRERERWFHEAYRTADLLQVSTQDSTLVPRAELMKAHLDEKMGRFESAAETFVQVAGTYGKVKQVLDQQLARHSDPVQYFNEVAGKNLESFDLSAYLPPLAVHWMGRNDQMAAALGVVRDLEAGRRWSRESRALLASLDELLADTGDRVHLFPVLREGVKRLEEVENARALLERNLSRAEETLIEAHVQPAERRELAAARRTREELERRMEGLPTTRRAMQERETRARKRVEDLELSVFQLGIQLRGMKAQLGAMEEWLRRHEDEFRGREEAVRDFREELRRGYAMTHQLVAELDALGGQLATERSRAGLDAGAMAQEDVLRRQYDEAVARERTLAERIHARLGPEGAARIDRVQAVRLRSERLRAEVARLRQELAARVSREADRVRALAETERKNLDGFELELARLERESEGLAGEVAFRALEDVRAKFYQIVLEADVGSLDVSWGRKQSVTDEIAELNRKQTAERKRLFEEFKGVLSEVE